jgi:glutamine amidotransferase
VNAGATRQAIGPVVDGMTIGIVDYDRGNLRSVAGAVERLGGRPIVSSSAEELARADKLILPGVGAFGDGMSNLERLGLVTPLTRLVMDRGKPVLGICLGAQLMARESDEFGRHEGLGWIDAAVTRIAPADPSVRVPHVGWNSVRQTRASALFAGVPQDALFYFVHSFHIACGDADLAVAECEHGVRMTAAFQRGNVYGTQFHPEKSQRHGLMVVGNFLRAA